MIRRPQTAGGHAERIIAGGYGDNIFNFFFLRIYQDQIDAFGQLGRSRDIQTAESGIRILRCCQHIEDISAQIQAFKGWR